VSILTERLDAIADRMPASDDADYIRAAAAELRDGDRRHNSTVREYSKQLSDAGAAESRAYAERDRLRAVIENAPHAPQCDQFWELGKRAAMPCTCWKANASGGG
jgi:cytochrome c553